MLFRSSVVVEGEVGEFVAVPVPEAYQCSRPGDAAIIPWVNSLLKVGLVFHSEGYDTAIFRVDGIIFQEMKERLALEECKCSDSINFYLTIDGGALSDGIYIDKPRD